MLRADWLLESVGQNVNSRCLKNYLYLVGDVTMKEIAHNILIILNNNISESSTNKGTSTMIFVKDGLGNIC